MGYKYYHLGPDNIEELSRRTGTPIETFENEFLEALAADQAVIVKVREFDGEDE